MKSDHPIIFNSIVDKTGTIFYISDTIRQYYSPTDLNGKNICRLFDRFTIDLLYHSRVQFGKCWERNLISKDKEKIPVQIFYRGCIEILNGSYMKLYMLTIHPILSDSISENIMCETQFNNPNHNFAYFPEDDFLSQYYNEMIS
jgi:hypothetical protein